MPFRAIHSRNSYILLIILFIVIETINGTGLNSVDYEATGESITVLSSENATFNFDIRATDETCELEDKEFQMAIYDYRGYLLVSSIVNITIDPDTQCGKLFLSALL